MAENPEDLIVTDAELRRQLPALAKELKIGGSGGGVYYDATGKAVKYVYVVSATDPGKTRVVDGETVEVWWVQTTPPDPMKSKPVGVTADVSKRAFIVPDDPVASYTVDGVLRSPGTYSIGTASEKTLNWTATAKAGYGFAADAVTSGALVYPAKTYGAGDVVLSDSFAREGVLAGSTVDAFEGGEPLTWTNVQNKGSVNRTQGGLVVGVRSTDEVAVMAWDELIFPKPLDRFDFYIVHKVANPSVADTGYGASFRNGTLPVVNVDWRGAVVHNQPTGQSFPPPAGTAQGDLLRLEYRSGSVVKVVNVTKGVSTNYTGTYVPTASPVDRIRIDFRPLNNTPIGTLNYQGIDQIKVVAQ
ncbi:hypothetical protein [Micrococcus luteus]|uniref:hypothetical protein n=1 Tax=Micrococcus luteus TaxID=1270 RepID=UPI003D705160